MSPPRVVVIGGGLSGISAALTLADAGSEVTLLERRQRLGGLTWSFWRNGLSFDNGQHVFLRCCTAYIEFLERIGATDAVYLQPRLDIPVLSPKGTRGVDRAAARCGRRFTWRPPWPATGTWGLLTASGWPGRRWP